MKVKLSADRTIYDHEPFPEYDVARIAPSSARSFVETNHYSRGMTNAPGPCYGLFDGGFLIGAIVFATPCSENVRRLPYGPDRRDSVTELHRLVILDVTPRNAESFFIARAFRLLRCDRDRIHGVVSFADASKDHVGTIYQATNALYYGVGETRRFYIDADGRLRHRRQCGRNISPEEAVDRGWQTIRVGPKHRYFFTLPRDRRHARELTLDLRLEGQPYPKWSTSNGIKGAA